MLTQVNTKAAQDWLVKRKEMIKPWSEIINSNNFRKPVNVAQWSKRAVKNVEHYQTNYLFVFIGLIVYCIVTSPLLLIAICAFFLMSYFISARPPQSPIKILGHEISTTQQYGVAALCSFPFFFLAGAGSAVFWVLGVSFFLVGLHASFHVSQEEGNTEDEIPFMETV